LRTEDVSPEAKPDLQLEIAHLLLIDVVGYSKLLVNEQIEFLQELNQIVRSTESFRVAETSGRLVRLPTGDGMALIFFRSPEEPVRCALELSRSLQDHPHIQVRMGVHSGPVHQTTDVNDRSNVAGAGINIAQRIMDCGDAGHILLSKHVADDLAHYRNWQPYLHDLGECEVKHGLRLHVVNLYKDGLGNPGVPEKLKRGIRWKKARASIRPISTLRWPQWAVMVALLFSAVAVAVAFSVFFLRKFPSVPPGASEATARAVATIPEKSIAVLPFENLSEEKGNAYFTDGVQDEILTSLAKVADLKVISRTSVMQYKTGTERNLRDIAKALGVAHVVEGTVQRAGDRVRVSAQLIDARTDTHLWAERYDRELADVFRIQSEIAEKIVAQLKAKLSPQEKAAIQERPTADLAAYDLYIRAKSLVDAIGFNARAKEDLLEATRLLDKAVARDSAFLRAYYQLARAHDQIYFLGLDHTPARLALAEAAVQATQGLRPDAGEAHLALAQHLYWGYRQYDRALQELAIARRALPNEPLVLVLAGFIDRRQGRWEQSIQELETALELDPRNVFILQQISFSYEYLRRFADMAAVLDRVLTIAPEDVNTRVQRAFVDLEWHADPEPLHSVIQTIVAENPDMAATVADKWVLLAFYERDKAAADRAIAMLPPEGYFAESVAFPPAWCKGVISRALGDNAAAQAAFTRARSEVAQIIRAQPDYPEQLSVLGTIDAALGRKEEAIREGRRAVELLPVTQDSLTGSLLAVNLAVIYTWTGEKELGLEQLEMSTRVPSIVNYGTLRLHPFWDPLRGDPRFDKIVASLVPDEKKL
jgi:TolB-like protein/class 3 adenylate cyclase/Flp pilus assembly protein TadD